MAAEEPAPSMIVVLSLSMVIFFALPYALPRLRGQGWPGARTRARQDLLSGGMLVCPQCGEHFEARIAPWKGQANV
jgi:hypothetical protein